MKYFLLFVPFIILLSPILFLWEHNIEQVIVQGMGHIIGLFLFTCLVIVSISLLVMRDIALTVVVSSITIIVLFVYGPIYNASLVLYNFPNSVHHIASSYIIIGILALGIREIRKRKALKGLVKFLAVFGIVMFTFPLIKIGNYFLFSSPKNEVVISPPDFLKNAARIDSKELEKYPDVYLLIMDGYCREDILLSSYGFDNSRFINELQQRGFFVASKSTSNYPHTKLSLPSSLNLQYLNEFGHLSENEAYKMIHDNIAGQFLKKKGYQYITINTNWSGTETSKIADIQYKKALSNEFLYVLLGNSIANYIMPTFPEIHLHAFSSLEKISTLSGAKFTFAHFILPHSPYVFDAKGNQIATEKLSPSVLLDKAKDISEAGQASYIEQVQFTNKKILSAIDTIITNSKIPPIIILQADHGWNTEVIEDEPDLKYLRERFSILNAWLAPEKVTSKLSNDITPVNNFRILFSQIFDEELPLLENKSYRRDFSSKDYIDVTKSVK